MQHCLRKSFRNFISIFWNLSNEFEMEEHHMEYVTVPSMFVGRCRIMRCQADDSVSVCKYHMRRLVRFMVCYSKVCPLVGQPSVAVGLWVRFRRFRKNMILNQKWVSLRYYSAGGKRVGIGCWRNETDKTNPKYSEKTLLYYQFVSHKFQVKRRGDERGPSWWETVDETAEST